MLTIDFSLIPINGGEKILDLGCGSGRHSWYVCKQDHCSVYAVDYDLESLQKARYMLGLMDKENETRGKWLVMQGNAMTLPFRDRSFDKIVCFDTLHEIPNWEEILIKWVYFLKREGKILFCDPELKIEQILNASKNGLKHLKTVKNIHLFSQE